MLIPCERSQIRVATLLTGVSLLLAGCATTLPAYPTLTARDTLETLATRAESIETLRARANLTLVNPGGQSIDLAGSVSVVPPNRLRVVASKFGATVVDVTYVDGEVWSVPILNRVDLLKGITARQIDRTLAILNPAFWRRAHPVETADTQPDLVAVVEEGEQGSVTCTIDRATATARGFTDTPTGNAGAAPRSLSLENYRVIDGVVWPTLLRLIGGEGTVEVALHEIEINHPIEAATFVPPPRARKRP